MNDGIVAFNAFNGISGASLALERAGVKVRLNLSSELITIDGKLNPAVIITQTRYPKTLQLGDISNINGLLLRGFVDLMTGGSPCQSFSNAGKREGFDGVSKLFWKWVELRDQINPRYWFFENVRMKKEWIKIISDALGTQPYYINSSLVSGQNRPRVYWTNIPYTELKDKGILLGDVILGAITGVGKHGTEIPEHLRKVGGPKWKNIGWEDNVRYKANCLTTSRGHYRNIQGGVIPYTPEDCEALQTFPIGFTNVPGVTEAQRIKALGNSWTIDVIVEAFFKNLPWAKDFKVNPRVKILNV